MAQNEIERLVQLVEQAGSMAYEDLRAAAAIPLSQHNMTLLRERLNFRLAVDADGNRVHTVSAKGENS